MFQCTHVCACPFHFTRRSILLLGFWANGKMTRNTDVSGWPSIPLNFTMLVNSLYIAASVLIAYSSLIGRVSFAQAYGKGGLRVLCALHC